MATEAQIRANRENAKKGGRKKGGKNKKTLILEQAQKEFDIQVAKIAKQLLLAQATEALGARQLIRKDEIYNKKGKMVKVEFNVVTDPKEMERVFNEWQDIDGSGEVDGKFYMTTIDKPNYRASDALLNRAFGRPKETVKLSGDKDAPLLIRFDK